MRIWIARAMATVTIIALVVLALLVAWQRN